MAEEIKMYRCKDGRTYEDKDEAERHDTRLKIEKKVMNYLDFALNDKVANHTRSSLKDVFVDHWTKIQEYLKTKTGYDKEIFDLCIDGLMMQKIEHKQWYLEQILSLVVDDIGETRQRFNWTMALKPEKPDEES